MVNSPFNILKLLFPARLPKRAVFALSLQVQGCPPEAALVICEDSYIACRPGGKHMFVPSNVLDKPMHENYDSLCCGSGAVRASIELSALWTNQPRLRVSRHNLQEDLYLVIQTLISDSAIVIMLTNVSTLAYLISHN